MKKRRKVRAPAPVSIDREPGGARLVLIAILLMLLAVLPHFGHLRPEPLLLFLVFAGWRLASLRWPRLPRGRWVVIGFAVVGFSITASIYGAPLGRDPGVAFLLTLLGLKCIEMNRRRDLDVIVLLGYFIVITHFLYADGINWALPLLFVVTGFTWLLTQAGHTGNARTGLADLRLVGRMLLQALPFVVVLFYLFPRLSGSVFLFQADTRSAMTGLSDTLTMGSISELIESEQVAFVATFVNGPLPQPAERYWRGNVMWATDGREWRRGKNLPFLRSDAVPGPLPPDATRYEVALEPGNQDWLFALDYPAIVPDGATRDSDNHLYLGRPLERPFRYDMAVTETPPPEHLDRGARWMSLRTDGTVVTPRLQALVDDLVTGAESPRDIANRALAHFNRNEFIYTLRPPLLESDAPVDEFLFETRRGFCGHYASSFAILMRLAGIPSRLVTGYLGGQENPRADQIVVRQSEAHAWTEIWLPDAGWTRVDPTAAVAPERIERMIDFDSSLDSEGLVLFENTNLRGLQRLSIELVWLKDAIKAKWNRWFTTFDQDRQRELLQRLGLGGFDMRLVSMAAFLTALGLLTLVSLLLFRGERRRADDPVFRLYRRFQDRLARLGVHPVIGEGPRDFAERAAQALPARRETIDAIARRYIELRYTGDGAVNADALRQFRRLLDAL